MQEALGSIPSTVKKEMKLKNNKIMRVNMTGKEGRDGGDSASLADIGQQGTGQRQQRKRPAFGPDCHSTPLTSEV
jgi:hypothetical protein